MATLWGGTSIKLVLGGCTETPELEQISQLFGDRWARRESLNQPSGLFGQARGSSSNSVESERRLTVDQISEMGVGTGLLLYRSSVREQIRLPAWWERPDHQQFHESIRRARATIAASNRLP